MTLLVRDEQDIIRDNIEFHLAHGVDHIIATDNASQDGTREILDEYHRLGVLDVIDEPGRNYAQWKWVTRMAFSAREDYCADWIINNDADEFWMPKHGCLKEEISLQRNDILSCNRLNMVFAHDDDSIAPWHQRIICRVAEQIPKPLLANPLKDELPAPYFYLQLPGKVILKSKGLLKVHQGNHGADYDRPTSTQDSSTIIYHFPIRSKEQLLLKSKQGGEAYANNTEFSINTGWHWRRWHGMLNETKVNTLLADALPNQVQLKSDIASRTLVEDATIKDYFREQIVGV